MVVTAVAMLVRMVMAAVLVIVVVIIVGMAMIVTFAACIFSSHGEQIEETKDKEADTGNENHRAEDAIRW